MSLLAWIQTFTSRLTIRGSRRPPSWARVEELFAAAAAQPADRRESYIARAAAGDPRLQAEVLALLAASEQPGLVDRPLGDLVTPLLTSEETVIGEPVRRVIAHYELGERLRGGGMGVIYRARDLRLERDVALKFLPPALGSDERAKARFLLEARTAAALDHRNICTIHEIGETPDAQLFIAMPFYPGLTLAERLDSGPLPVREAVDIALQIALGLAHAHERGSVHRDIKPANIMLTPEGVVKILDFGIVKQGEKGLTRTGAVIGTVPYMSPEQLRGHSLDARTDVWSLGVVLFEMLAARRPFAADDEHALRDAILFSPPASLAALRPDLPNELAGSVNAALSKDPADRHGSAHNFARALEAVQRALDSTGAAESARDGTELRQLTETAQVLPGGERRQTSVVVCSISGLADLMDRGAPRDVEQLMRRIKQDAWAIAERHQGTLNECGEDRIVVVFGVPISLEDHCSRAVRAARDLHNAVNEWRQSRPIASNLALHTAIDTGEAAVQKVDGALIPYRIGGQPIRRATQLAGHAHTNEILISSEGRRAVASLFELARVDPVSLPDYPEPLTPWRVIRESATQEHLDRMAGRATLTTFVGRNAELETLLAAFEDAKASRGRFVTVTGEAGLGKSRLLLELRRKVDAEAATVVIGRCSSYGQGSAYLPFLEVLRQILRLDPQSPDAYTDEDVANRIVDLDAALVSFVSFYLHLLSIPSDKHRVPRLFDEQIRLAFQEALVAAIVASAHRRPMVVLLEDWHWVDHASKAVLKQAADLISEHRLLIVVTSRSASGSEWGLREAHVPVVLRPLESTSAIAMVRAVLDADDVPAELATKIQERSGGNPFFIEEIGHTLIEARTISIADRRARLVGSLETLSLPPTVQAAIRTRLDRLDLNSRQVLRVASVAGRDFSRRLLEHAVADSTTVAPALTTLVAAGIVQQTAVVPEATFRFRHALTQEAAYAGLLEHQRADLHAAVGEAIETLHAGHLDEWLDRLARHFSLSEDWQKAVRYALLSADRMEGLSQFLEALQFLDRTRDWIALFDEEQRDRVLVDVLFRQERLCDTLGLRERQRQIVEELVARLEPAGDPARLAEAYVRKGDFHTILRQFGPAEDALQRALALHQQLRDGPGRSRTLRSLGFQAWFQDRDADARAWVEEALRMDREHDNLMGVLDDLHNLGSICNSAGDTELAVGYWEEALRLSEPTGGDSARDSDLAWKRDNVLYNYGRLLTEQGELDRALACLEPLAARAKAIPVQASYSYTAIAYVHFKKGNIADALHYYSQAIDLTRRAHYAPGLARALRLQGEVLLALGRTQEAVVSLQEAAAVFGEIEDSLAEAAMRARVAAAHEQLENFAEARVAWDRARRLRRDAGDRRGELEALEALGRVARRHLPAPVALRFYEEGVELASALGDGATAARLGNAAGILEWTRGRHVEALAHFERALERFRTADDPAGVGLMMNSIGVTLSTLGRRADARAQLERAVAYHQATGQRQLEGHALAALGDSYWDGSETERAYASYHESLEIRQAIGDLRGEGWMLQRLARANATSGNRIAAEELLNRAVDLSARCSDEELMEACAQLRRQALT